MFGLLCVIFVFGPSFVCCLLFVLLVLSLGWWVSLAGGLCCVAGCGFCLVLFVFCCSTLVAGGFLSI